MRNVAGHTACSECAVGTRHSNRVASLIREARPDLNGAANDELLAILWVATCRRDRSLAPALPAAKAYLKYIRSYHQRQNQQLTLGLYDE